MHYHSFGGKRRPSGFSRHKRVYQNSGRKEPKIDVSKFINKAVIQETPKEYIPVNHFKDFEIDLRLKQNVAIKGFLTPTPIQDQAIPHILNGKDIVGIANTGTGKTAAFLLPFLNKIIKNRRDKVLILAPTRELALQIRDDFNSFSNRLGIYSALCIGGENINKQIYNVQRNPNFVIGTPGRIKDLIQRRVLKLSTFNNVVLDEADRMLDMGFIKDIKEILGQLPKERHSLFFSATMSREIQELIKTFLKEPMTISVKVHETPMNVQQDIIRVTDGKKRLSVLHEMLGKNEFKKVLVFGRTKHGVEKLSKDLQAQGIRAVSIHGNKTQSKRQMALNSFKTNKVQVLVATDVAARGLDIPDVTHVINYDLPATYDDYVHRIGRTGRASKKGIALTFVV
ncbi:DEAD/DEAH box helicase [Candidatus Peregrinibacteria bacterium]|nr:DEAD/DEAH box helicase [Candidatus Peregrinibacteria bacterium]